MRSATPIDHPQRPSAPSGVEGGAITLRGQPAAEPGRTAKHIYFYRQFGGMTGGHLKVWHYFNHCLGQTPLSPSIYLEPGSLKDDSNPWARSPEVILNTWRPDDADLLFLGGNDWCHLPEPGRKNWPKPVLNLIQSVRHANPGSELYAHLANKAIRICVSQPVAESILATGRVNGPVFTIPAGLDQSELLPYRIPRAARDVDVLIAGLKNPAVAGELTRHLEDRGLRIHTLTTRLPREVFLRHLGNSRLAVFLPAPQEGFFLPPLEGMVLDVQVICPKGEGAASYGRHGENGLMPAYTPESLCQAVDRALAMSPGQLEGMLASGRETVSAFTLERERAAFATILERADALWT